MKLLRSLMIAAAVGLALAAGAETARAQDPSMSGVPYATGGGPIVAPGGGCATCGHGGVGGFGGVGRGGLFGGITPQQPKTLFGGQGLNLNIFHKQKPQLPVFQAAPWYNYWPYDGHFLTPAPISGPFYGPPLTGNFPVNPYFPAGFQGWGPIPGGPAPGPIPVMPPAPGGFPVPPPGGGR